MLPGESTELLLYVLGQLLTPLLGTVVIGFVEIRLVVDKIPGQNRFEFSLCWEDEEGDDENEEVDVEENNELEQPTLSET